MRTKPVIVNNFVSIFAVFFLLLPFSLSAQTKKANLVTDSLENLLTNIPDGKERVRLLNREAGKYLASQPEKSFHYAKRALKISESLDDPQGKADGYQYLGQIFYHQGAFTQAIQYFQKALSQYEQLADSESQADTYIHLGLVYHYSRQLDIALQNYEKALAIYEETNLPQGKANTLGYIGHVYEKKSDYQQALRYQQQALEIYRERSDSAGMARILDNIGSIYEDQEDFEEAHQYFMQALRYNQAQNQLLDAIVNLNNIGDTYRKRGDYEQALKYTRQSYQLAQKLKEKYQIRSALRDFSKIYAAMGDFEKAHQYLEESYNLYQEIYSDESAQQIARMQTLYETQEKDKEIALLERDQQLAHLQRYAILIMALLGLILGSVIISRQRLKIRKNRKIIEQNQRIYETQHELTQAELQNAQLNQQKLQTELENKQLREKNLQAELEARNKELTSRALNLIQKNEILSELKDKLHQILRHKDTDQSREIGQLVNLIDYSFHLDQDWEDFKTVFEQVHKDFFHHLQQQFPDLTAGELRLCALLRLNLNSKDIATILGISQDSLRVTRYRLRKKLDLPKGTNLVNFIMSV